MLRASARKQIIEILDGSIFSSSNFDIRFSNLDKNMLAHIIFLPKPEFTFSIEEAALEKWITSECPGLKLLKIEYFQKQSYDSCVYSISDWVDRIYEEYAHENPIMDEFSALREQIEAHIQAHNLDSGAFFTRAEGDALKKTIDELAAKIRDLSSQGNNSVSYAATDIETLKADTESMPKGAWYRKAGNKLLGAMKVVAKSSEGREFMLEAAKNVLLGGPKG